jgi:THO complex subunit 3
MSLGDGPGLSGGKLTATSLADVESIPIARHVDQLAFNNAKTFLASKATDSYKSGHQQKIQALSWNCEGKKLATASLDHSVKIWELENSGLRHKTMIPKAHAQAVQLLCWSKENPDLFITTAWDGQVIQWDARMDAKKRHVNKVASVVTKGENINMAWSPDGNIIAVGSKKDDISIIDARKFSDKSAIRSWSFRGLVEVRI